MIEKDTAPPVELSLVFTNDARDTVLLRHYDSLLTPSERQQRNRFHFERDRLRFMLTRVALREVLSRHAPVAPHAWRFLVNAYGKPRIAIAPWDSTLSFNVSHTDGLVMIGVTHALDLGVDVENVFREVSLDVADHFFAPMESAAMRRLPPQDQKRRFFELWTLKESYIKARGMGLSIPLDTFRFELEEPGRICVAFEPCLEDTRAGWRFWQFDASPSHLASVCLRVSGDAPKLSAVRMLPSVSRSPWHLKIRRSSQNRPAAGPILNLGPAAGHLTGQQ
jgi:4'-phosphopantetheinyl transferase